MMIMMMMMNRAITEKEEAEGRENESRGYCEEDQRNGARRRASHSKEESRVGSESGEWSGVQ